MGSYAVYPSLSGRNVFITGGATGIGESLVEAFVRQQARVAFIDLDLDAAQGLQKRLKDENFPEPWFEQCDVRDISALEKCLRKAASDLGPVSVLSTMLEMTCVIVLMTSVLNTGMTVSR